MERSPLKTLKAPDDKLVRKQISNFAKLATSQGYEYLIVAFPTPGQGQAQMNAEVAFDWKDPGNMASLLLGFHQHPEAAKMFAMLDTMKERFLKIEKQPANEPLTTPSHPDLHPGQ